MVTHIPECSKWRYMVDIKSSLGLLLIYSASAALVAVALARQSSLAIPVLAVIVGSTTFPVVIIFAGLVDRSPLGCAFSVAKMKLIATEPPRLWAKFLVTRRASDEWPGRVPPRRIFATPSLALPNAVALCAAKLLFSPVYMILVSLEFLAAFLAAGNRFSCCFPRSKAGQIAIKSTRLIRLDIGRRLLRRFPALIARHAYLFFCHKKYLLSAVVGLLAEGAPIADRRHEIAYQIMSQLPNGDASLSPFIIAHTGVKPQWAQAQ